jgi:tetratricopeptide (TPR) repeat protein
MFMARRKPSGSQATLERRFDFHVGEAIRASLAGSHDKAEAHSGTALAISRELYRGCRSHRPALAEALACHAASHAAYGRISETMALLTESAGHYAVLARDDPDDYEVARIDVLARVALASDAVGNTQDAIALLREVIRMYGRAPATAQAERDFGLARARFYLGGCLLKTGARHPGLAQLDTGLADAERAWRHLRRTHAPAVKVPLQTRDNGESGEPEGHREPASAARQVPWLWTAPRFVQLGAPDWATAAVRAMTLHAAAGRWGNAARAARVAVRLSAGLAALGGEEQRESYAAVRARAAAIWARDRARRSAVGLQEAGLQEGLRNSGLVLRVGLVQ